jgi:hypothetical protein
MGESLQRIGDFQGFARDANPASLPPSLFYTDEGGDLFERGTWRVRRGQVRIQLPTIGGSVQTMFAFETRPGTLALIVVDSNGTFYGFNALNYTGTPVTYDLEGEGVGGAGEGGYGE